MSEVISARLPQDYQLRLEALLDGQSLGAWLRQVIDDGEKVQGLAAEAGRLARVIARRRQELEAVEGALEGRRATAAQLENLHRAGLTTVKLASWSRVLGGAGVEVSDLAGQLERYGSLAAACRELEERHTRLAQAVKTLGRKQAELEGGIGAVRTSAVEAMSEVRKKAVAEVEALMKGLREKVAAHGEACRLGEVLARDLPLAAYLHSMAQPHLADKVPPETVLSILDRIRRWAEATGQTVKGKPPKAVASSNALIAYMELDLQQLILWTAALLLPLCQEDAKQAAVRPAD